MNKATTVARRRSEVRLRVRLRVSQLSATTEPASSGHELPLQPLPLLLLLLLLLEPGIWQLVGSGRQG